MDLIKKNLFLSACVGVFVLTVGVVGLGFMKNDPGPAIAAYKTLEGQVTTKAASATQAAVVVAEKKRDARYEGLRSVEKALSERALNNDGAVYLVYWGKEERTAVVDAAARKVRLTTELAGTTHQSVHPLGKDGPEIAGMALVDPQGSPARLAEWKAGNQIPEATFILMPGTLHGRLFTRAGGADQFHTKYAQITRELKETLGAVEPDKDFSLRLREHYGKYRSEHAYWVAKVDHIAKEKRRIAEKPKDPPIKWDEVLPKHLVLPRQPEVTPADQWKRAEARTGWIWWVEDALQQEPWVKAAAPPSPAQMFFAQMRVWMLRDIVTCAADVNGNGPNGAAPPARRPLSDQDRRELELARKDLDKLFLESGLKAKKAAGDDVEKKKEEADKFKVPPRPSDAALTRLAELFGGPVLEDKDGRLEQTVRRGKFEHLDNPRQGVLGSEIKMVPQIAFWAANLTIPDAVKDSNVEWMFLPQTEPIVADAAVGGGAPAAGPAGKADPKKAAPAPEASKAEGEAAGPPAIRRFNRPTSAEKAAFLAAFDAKKYNFGARMGNPALSATAPIRSDYLGRPDLSITRRGTGNDFFVVHLAVQLIATPRGVDQFIKLLEERRYYTLARAPELAAVDRGRYPAHDLGPDGLLEATLYFEAIIYQNSVRRWLEPSETGLGRPVLATLMPPELWAHVLDVQGGVKTKK